MYCILIILAMVLLSCPLNSSDLLVCWQSRTERRIQQTREDGGNAQNDKLEMMLRESSHMRAYMRLSGGLVQLIRSGQFQALAEALQGEHKSQLTLWQNGQLTKVQEALNDSARSMSQRCAAAKVMKVGEQDRSFFVPKFLPCLVKEDLFVLILSFYCFPFLYYMKIKDAIVFLY